MPLEHTPPQTPAPCLPFVDHGQQAGQSQLPVVFLHGFGSDRQGWHNIQTALGSRKHTIAFDLPGHGKAVDWPETGRSGTAAKALIASLDHLSLDKVHLVGHSLGGAIASLLTLKNPKRIASLTLLSPGGFGPEINHALLRRYAKAMTEQEAAILLEQFFGPGYRMPKYLARTTVEMRKAPGAEAALSAIFRSFMQGHEQKHLPVETLASLDCPVKVVWGTADRVLPVSQSQGLPGRLACHRFAGVGHMPHYEIPSEVIRLILQNTAAG